MVAVADEDGAQASESIDWINRTARVEGLAATALVAPPTAIATTVRALAGGRFDLVLIDRWRSNEQQTGDFQACRAVASDDCIYLVRDILDKNMAVAAVDIRKSYFYMGMITAGLCDSAILTRTASMMGAFSPKSADSRLKDVLLAFTDAFAFWSATASADQDASAKSAAR